MHDLKLKEEFSCRCMFFNGENCSLYFKEELLPSLRMMYMEMDNTTLDLLILAQIRSHIHKGQETVKTRIKSQTNRK